METSYDSAALEAVNLNMLVEEVVTTYNIRAQSAGLSLVFTPGQTLPCVRGRGSDLIRMITNLLTNAISYTPAGQIMIRTYTSEAAHEICLEVEDTGIGISSEDMPHVFERFYRGRHVGSSNIPGTGLGLAITQEIVLWHNGQIEVESEPGKGSTFRIRLPISPC
jgi:signal transduction histidine kinase